MPIEIKELVIKANVQETNGAVTGSTTPGNSSSGTENTDGQQQLIEECVRQVLAILERKNER